MHPASAFRPLLLAAALGLAGPAHAESPAATPPAAASTPATAAANNTEKSDKVRQVAGVQRLRVGDLLVTALYDGRGFLAVNTLQGIAAADAAAQLDAHFVPRDGDTMQIAVNAFLIEKDGQRLLVDAGAAACFGPTLGNVPANLRAAGVEPASINAVLLTHLHPDHVCGITGADGGRVFPNADILVAQEEAADYWLDTDKMAAAPETLRDMFATAQKALKPYQDAGRVKPFKSGDTPLPGVQALASPGHTPGHVSYLFAAAGSTPLLVWGDIVHSSAVQFAAPDVTVVFDSNAATAARTRAALLDRAAREKLWVAGAHLPFPGLGHVARDGDTYRWVPVEFAPLDDE